MTNFRNMLPVTAVLFACAQAALAQEVTPGLPSAAGAPGPSGPEGPPAAATSAPAATTPAAAEQPGSWFPGTFSGTVSLNNDYMFRGISQTDHNPALQGNINYTSPTFYGTSIYGGIWGSNLDFNDDAANRDKGAHLELDWSFGLTGTVADAGLGWTLGAIYYDYPGARQGLSYNYWEFAPQLSYAVNDWLSFTGGLNYSPDYFGGSGNGYYPNAGVTAKIPMPNEWFSLSAFAMTGHQWIEKNSKFGTDDYQDWKVGLTAGIKNITLTAAYTDTSLDKSSCFGGTNLCEPRALLSLGAAF